MGRLCEHALDERYDERQGTGFPFSWWHVGQLLGRLDTNSEAELASRGASGWRLLLQIETNPVTDFAGGCDTAPVLIAVQTASSDGRIDWRERPLPVRALLAP
jgi:hypothetical protein